MLKSREVASEQASFRATLEEVELPRFSCTFRTQRALYDEEQKAQVEKVLTELAVSTKPVIQVMNKVDLISPQELAHLSGDREAVPISALRHTGLHQLLM